MKTSFLALLIAVLLVTAIRVSGYALGAATLCAVGFAAALNAWALSSYGRAVPRLQPLVPDRKLRPAIERPLGDMPEPAKRDTDRLAA
jgi:hypothetical protein